MAAGGVRVFGSAETLTAKLHYYHTVIIILPTTAEAHVAAYNVGIRTKGFANVVSLAVIARLAKLFVGACAFAAGERM